MATAEGIKAKADKDNAAKHEVAKREAFAAVSALRAAYPSTPGEIAATNESTDQIYAVNGTVTTDDVQNAVKSVAGPILNIPEIKERKSFTTQIIDWLAKEQFGKRDALVGSDKAKSTLLELLTNVGETDSEFKSVIYSRELRIMAELQRNIAPILITDYKGKTEEEIKNLKRVALVASIEKTLIENTEKKLPRAVNEAAIKIADDIITRDNAIRTEVIGLLEENGITGNKNKEVKKQKAEIDADELKDIYAKENAKIAIDASEKLKGEQIAASLTERIWPVMMSRDIPDEKKLEYVQSVIADSVRGKGAQNSKLLNTAVSKLTLVAGKKRYALGPNGEIPADHQFVIDTIKQTSGSNSLSNLTGIDTSQLGWVTTGAVGATALAAASSMSWWQKIAAGAVLIGGAVAYETGALSGMFKPDATPAGTKPPEDKSTSVAAK